VIDEIARDVSSYEYGLPLYDDAAKARLREAVYQWSCNALTPTANSGNVSVPRS
jgi:hypothetical protein